MDKGSTGSIINLLDETIRETGSLKLSALPASAKCQDRTFEVNMRLAEKPQSILRRIPYLDVADKKALAGRARFFCRTNERL
jgi:hypothetical protein